MKINYYLVSTIFSLISAGQLAYVLLWIMGMEEVDTLSLELILIITLVLATIILLIAFPYTKRKSVATQTTAGLISIVFVLVTRVVTASDKLICVTAI